MFYIIEIFSDNLNFLFSLILDLLESHHYKIILKEVKENDFFIVTEAFNLNISFDNIRQVFDKEDYNININTVLWFNVVPNSNYDIIIISILKLILKNFESDCIFFDTGYSPLLIRKDSKLEITNDSPICSKIKETIKNEENSE